jgi:hypothetical protein
MPRELPREGFLYTRDEVKALFGFASLASLDKAVQEGRFPMPLKDDNRQADPLWSGAVLLDWIRIKPFLRPQEPGEDQGRKGPRKTDGDPPQLGAD